MLARRRTRGQTRVGRTALAVALAVVAGCSDSSSVSSPRPAVQHGELTLDAVVRTYRVYSPITLGRHVKAPLVLVLGGYGNSADEMVAVTEFDREAATGDFVVAYAEGIGGSWNAGFCCGRTARDGVDDVAFLSALIDRLQVDYGIDPDRVYVAGVSVGAMMAYRLGCEAAQRIAGVGAVAGAMILDDCQPARPVPVIEIHGTEDPLVPYEGGVVQPEGVATQPVPPTSAVVQRWASLNRCPSAPHEETDGPVRTATWAGCAGGSAVKLIVVDGGTHTWFAPGLGAANGAVHATHLMWSFFDGLRPGG